MNMRAEESFAPPDWYWLGSAPSHTGLPVQALTPITHIFTDFFCVLHTLLVIYNPNTDIVYV